MTLAVRNTILRTALLVAIGLLVIYGFAVYRLLTTYAEFEPEFAHTALFGWLAGASGSHAAGVRALIAGLGVLGGFTIFWVATLIRQFRRRTAPEVFFFTVFIASIALDLLRPLVLVSAGAAVPLPYRSLLARLVYFGYLFGALSLFSSSLAISVVDSQRSGVVLGLAAVISGAFAYFVPVAATQLYPNLVYRIGLAGATHATGAAIGAFAVLNFLHAGFTGGDREYAVLGGAVALVVVGRLVVFHLPHVLAVTVGVVCLIGGAVLFGRRSHQRYLWQ